MTLRVFIDTCALYPPLLRSLMLATTEAGLVRPLWSTRVLDEWVIATARKAPDRLAEAETDRARLAAAYPEALCPADPALEAQLSLPDPADAHVLAAAAAADADLLVTLNLRDFPRMTLAGLGLEARHPDSLLWELWSAHPAAMERVLAAALPGLAPPDRRGPLKRARLSRLGKAQAA
ncbi:MAG: PIN domain-containing protein [Pseudomonadota bacterium]